MPPDQVAARARFMLAGLKDLPSMSSPRARAQAAEAFGSASEAERQEVERLEELRRPPHPICDPAGPCDCRPHRPAPFPMPSEVGQAARAVELMERWPLHPQNIYHSLEAASQAMSAPADAALLATELQAIAAGKGGCK